jgi:hypothetical protein
MTREDGSLIHLDMKEKEPHVIARFESDVGSPAVAPDGKQVAVVKIGQSVAEKTITDTSQVLTYTLDGKRQHISKEFRVERPRNPGSSETVTECRTYWMAWSPDGKRIAFVGGGLGLVHYDRSAERFHTMPRLVPVFTDSQPNLAFTPDGQGMLCLRIEEGKKPDAKSLPKFLLVDWVGRERTLRWSSEAERAWRTKSNGKGPQRKRVPEIVAWKDGLCVISCGSGSFRLNPTDCTIGYSDEPSQRALSEYADAEGVDILGRFASGVVVYQKSVEAVRHLGVAVPSERTSKVVVATAANFGECIMSPDGKLAFVEYYASEKEKRFRIFDANGRVVTDGLR